MMYDTVKFQLNIEKPLENGMLFRISDQVDQFTECQTRSDVYYLGRINNLKISINDRRVSVHGSLAKYYLNDNIHTMTRELTKFAIDKLSDQLCLSFGKAAVKQIHIAHNFEMKYKPVTYYPYLGECRYYKRLLQPESLYYKNGNRAIVFYDKVKESKYTRTTIPDEWAGKHILRYELRLIRRLDKLLKEPIIQASTLFQEEFYKKLMNRYVREYQAIHKVPKLHLDYSRINTPAEYLRLCALIQMQERGLDKIMEQIEEMRSLNVFKTQESYSRLKRQIKDQIQKYEAPESSPLLNELDEKIHSLVA